MQERVDSMGSNGGQNKDVGHTYVGGTECAIYLVGRHSIAGGLFRGLDEFRREGLDVHGCD